MVQVIFDAQEGPSRLKAFVFVNTESTYVTLTSPQIQVANTYIKSLDKILDAFQRIGENLPRFENYAKIFYDNQQMQKVISLMYEDILNFHRFTLKFFRKRGNGLAPYIYRLTAQVLIGPVLLNL